MLLLSLSRLIKFSLQNFFRNIWLSVVTITIVVLTLFSVKIRKRIFEFFSGWAEGPLPALLRKALQAGGLGGHSTRAKLGAG